MSQKSTKEIADQGERIYRKIAPDLRGERGKYLAIDVDTEKIYVADSPYEAVRKAQSGHPHGSFHLVRIGSESLYRVASYGQTVVRR